jgi:DeoR/GlpR family transcriptional regulator of sugar metabolism
VRFGSEEKPTDGIARGDGARTAARASWVQYWSEKQIELKQILSHFAATHFIKYGTVVQIGSGTTFNFLMKEIVQMQTDKKEPLDLMILTTNLEVMEEGRNAGKKLEQADLFKDMQVVLTGGKLQTSLRSLVGKYAAEGVRTEVIYPQVVFFGAVGLSFDGGRVTIRYQFEEELSTQVGYATRPTDHRILLCDHTKLGRKGGWKADITAESMLEDTDRCSIITTIPDEGDSNFSVFEEEVRGFAELLDSLAKNEMFENKDFTWLMIRTPYEPNSEVALSLSEWRSKRGAGILENVLEAIRAKESKPNGS